MQRINSSVGKGGVNKSGDVKIVQGLLNLKPMAGHTLPLKVDGIIGAKTLSRIEAFQRGIVKLPRPDGRVDPNGRTLAALNKSTPAATATNNTKVVYATSLDASKRIVSPYSISLIQHALKKINMTQAVITSTIRTPAEQARIMYEQAAKNLQDQFRLYGATGDEVLKVYKNNRGRPRQEVIALMQAKIEELLKQGRRTSKHVVTDAQYKSLNIIDIGVNSTRAACGASFNMSGFTKVLRDLQTNGYIDKFIDETGKSNSCWHIEVTPNKKPLP